MGEETTKTSLFPIEQCHYLRQIWTSISQVLVFTPDLFQELSVVSSTLARDHAYIDSIVPISYQLPDGCFDRATNYWLPDDGITLICPVSMILHHK